MVLPVFRYVITILLLKLVQVTKKCYRLRKNPKTQNDYISKKLMPTGINCVQGQISLKYLTKGCHKKVQDFLDIIATNSQVLKKK